MDAHDEFMKATHKYCDMRGKGMPIPPNAAVIGSGLYGGGVFQFAEKHPWLSGLGMAALGLATGGIGDVAAAGFEGLSAAAEAAETASEAAASGSEVSEGVEGQEMESTAARKGAKGAAKNAKKEARDRFGFTKKGAAAGVGLGGMTALNEYMSGASASDASAAQQQAMAASSIAAKNQAAQAASAGQEAGDAMQSQSAGRRTVAAYLQ